MIHIFLNESSINHNNSQTSKEKADDAIASPRLEVAMADLNPQIGLLIGLGYAEM
jgi:hypothetical protein